MPINLYDTGIFMYVSTWSTVYYASVTRHNIHHTVDLCWNVLFQGHNRQRFLPRRTCDIQTGDDIGHHSRLQQDYVHL